MIAHQKMIRDSLLKQDMAVMGFSRSQVDGLRVGDFILACEKFSHEIYGFITRYEWLKSIGYAPQYTFTARYGKFLGGAVLVSDPYWPSKLLRKPFQGQKYEALVSRGACAGWTPVNLASNLISFACNWMAINTVKRIFCAYADPSAGEIGTVYQASNFDYVGAIWGKRRIELFGKLQHPRALYYAATWQKACDKMGIFCDPKWFKNGRANQRLVPAYIWGSVLFNLRHIATGKMESSWKHKYCLILGKYKTKTKKLRAMRLYYPESYPKRESEQAYGNSKSD